MMHCSCCKKTITTEDTCATVCNSCTEAVLKTMIADKKLSQEEASVFTKGKKEKTRIPKVSIVTKCRVFLTRCIIGIYPIGYVVTTILILFSAAITAIHFSKSEKMYNILTTFPANSPAVSNLIDEECLQQKSIRTNEKIIIDYTCGFIAGSGCSVRSEKILDPKGRVFVSRTNIIECADGSKSQ